MSGSPGLSGSARPVSMSDAEILEQFLGAAEAFTPVLVQFLHCVDRGFVREENPGDFGIMTLLGALTPDQGPSLQVVNDCQGHYRVFSTYSCYVSGQNCQYRFSYNDPNTAIHDDGYCNMRTQMVSVPLSPPNAGCPRRQRGSRSSSGALGGSSCAPGGHRNG